MPDNSVCCKASWELTQGLSRSIGVLVGGGHWWRLSAPVAVLGQMFKYEPKEELLSEMHQN